MSEKLKPCPFCGNDRAFITGTGNTHYIICPDCECSVAFFNKGHNISMMDDKDAYRKIISAYNKRFRKS